MTTTVLDLIKGALRDIGQYAPGEPLDADDAQDALDACNGMLDLWSTEHLMVFNNVETVKTFTPGKAVYTIGTGGDWDMPRPLRISDGCYTRITSNSTVDFPCEEISFDRYASIGLKSQPGPWPKVMYYNTGYPLAELRFWPVPQAGYEFHLWADMVFSQFTAFTDVLTMPQGYQLAIRKNLALLLAPEYGVQPSQELKEQARSFKRIIKDMNATPQATVGVDAAISSQPSGNGNWILSGGF